MPTELKILFRRIHAHEENLPERNRAAHFHSSPFLMADEEEEEEDDPSIYFIYFYLFFCFHFISFIPNIFNTSKRSVQNNFLSIQHI